MSYVLSNEEVLTAVNAGYLISKDNRGNFLVARQGDAARARPVQEDAEFWNEILERRGIFEDEDEVDPLPATLDFNFYMHDTSSYSEFQELVEDQTGYSLSEELLEKIGRPFYEVTLACTLDTTTGKVTINSTRM